MALSNDLISQFVKMTNDKDTSKKSTTVNGTVVEHAGGNYVRLDGSDLLTPVSTTADMKPGERVTVLLGNHKATVTGNLSSPAARVDDVEEVKVNTDEALLKANDAKDSADNALAKSEEAKTLVDSANANAEQSKKDAETAILKAQEASEAASKVEASLEKAVTNAEQALVSANSALSASETASSNAQTAINTANTVKADAEQLSTDLENAVSDLNGKIETVTNTMTTDYATKTEVATVEGSLETKITESAAGITADLTNNYSRKSDLTEAEGRLNTKIEAQAGQITTIVGDVSRIDATSQEAIAAANTAQENAETAVNAATSAESKSQAAQTAANEAIEQADAANTAATNAATAAAKAQSELDTAKTDLANAKKNLEDVTSRVDATEEDIASAKTAVDEAQKAVSKAQADAEAANTSANNAQTAANSAKEVADNAKKAADQAKADADAANEAVSGLGVRVTTAETAIVQNTNDIALRASKDVVDELGTRVSSAESSIETMSGQIRTKVDSTSDDWLKTTEMVQNADGFNWSIDEIAVVSTEIQYALGDDTKTAPTSGWDSSYIWTEGKYVWQRSRYKYANDTYSSWSTAVCISGNTGSNGSDYSHGKMLYKDPSFAVGTNDTEVYDESQNGNVTITRDGKSSDNPMLDTEYELVITNKGESSPGCGGFKFANQTRANAIFIYRIIAKIPVGRDIEWAANDFGNGSSVAWITSKSGTGAFAEYICKAVCGPTGTFSTIGYFYINGDCGTEESPVIWNVAYATCYDMTNYSEVLESSKTATNFMSYDNTNGLLVGNKTSGEWSGNRAQITSDEFNILDKEGKQLASYGPTTMIGKADGNNVHIDNDSVDIRNGSTVDASFGSYTTIGNRSSEELIFEDYPFPILVSATNGIGSFTVGTDNLAPGAYAIAFGYQSMAKGDYAYAEGYGSLADGEYSHAEGFMAYAGVHSHAEGQFAFASGRTAHAEGHRTKATGTFSHAEGKYTIALGEASHTSGEFTIASDRCQYAIGRFNEEVNGAFVIGNGQSKDDRSNAMVVDWDGNITAGNRIQLRGLEKEINISIGVDSGGINRGIYDNESSKWMIYSNENDLYLGPPSCTTPFKPYRRRGDSFTVFWRGSGYLTGGGKTVVFTISLNSPVLDPSGVAITVTSHASGGLRLRQNNGYTHGSSSNTYVKPKSYTASLNNGNLLIIAEMNNTTNATNNSPIGIDASIQIDLS